MYLMFLIFAFFSKPSAISNIIVWIVAKGKQKIPNISHLPALSARACPELDVALSEVEGAVEWEGSGLKMTLRLEQFSASSVKSVV